MYKIAAALALLAVLGVAQSANIHKVNRSHVECPDQKNPGVLVSDQTISKGLFESIKVRVPEVGLLDNTISCILIVDLKNGAHDPVISQGGLGSNSVEIQISPGLFESLSYRIQVYTNPPTTTGASTATT